MFVVDDLVGWLVGRVADAGYQRLTTLLRGSDQARALKQAVTAAVQGTVDEFGFSGGEADWAAEQINRAFGRLDPVPLPPGQLTVLEALQAGIAGQLSARDDAGQPVVSLPGVPAGEVAAKLTGHLVREIQVRGSRGGPLADLADQLNHDLTHLQGQRLEGMLAQALDWLGDGQAPAGGAAGPVGQSLAEVGDPFALEVHRPVEPDAPQRGLPVLPVYVPRGHDAVLAEVVTAAAGRVSGIAVLVGGSSTGKTRACWEALEVLRGLEPGWRLWHPIESQEALDELPGAGPWTVVWLNEAQRYLETPGRTGEEVAAGLRKLLRDQARGPVLVLATLWPEFWARLTASPSGGEDPHAYARELLTGHSIRVPDAFTQEELRELEMAGDPRLAQAVAGSRDRRVIQYLAGAADLLDRYHHAPPAARALIHAAMDASRLGMRPALPRAFLAAAAPGYLTDSEWEELDDRWLEQALRDTAGRSKGVSGPLAPVRARPAAGVPAGPADDSARQLADYLHQHGRRTRRELIPPTDFWAAAASYADPADLVTLAGAAANRGLLRDAARLYKQASAYGYPEAGANLVRLLHTLHPSDQRPADWAAANVALDDPIGMARLLNALRKAGATGQAATLASRAAAEVSLDDPIGVAGLLDALREAGATGQVAALASRAAAEVSLDDPAVVAELLHALVEARATGQVSTLLDRNPAAQVSLDNSDGVGTLLRPLRYLEATGQVATLASRAAAEVSLDDPAAVAGLLDALREAGATGQAAALASLDDPAAVTRLLDALRRAGTDGQVTTMLDRDPAAHVRLDDPYGLARLLNALREAGATGQAAALADRAAAEVSLASLDGLAELLDALREAGAAGQLATLAGRAAAEVSFGYLYRLARLLNALRKAGATGQAAALASRAAAEVSHDDPDIVARLVGALREAEYYGQAGAAGQLAALLDRDPAADVSLDDADAVAHLLDALRNAGATGQGGPVGQAGAADQVAALLDRDPVAHASLDDPGAVADLLSALRRAGATGQARATDQVAALLDRDPVAHASFDNPTAVVSLLFALREVGASADVAELIQRLPAAGLFDRFCALEGRGDQFRFGRDADGHSARRWTWTDLG